ncbi:MAG: hypothetical protein R2942_12880 [Ignavibacteria bacterium]
MLLTSIKVFAIILYKIREDAIAAFDIVNNLDNAYFQSWLWKARSEEALEKIDDAIVSIKKAIEIDPESESAKEDLQRLEQKKQQ